MTTMKRAKEVLRGIATINRTQAGDYRACLLWAEPSTAYYTDDLDDAVGTMLAEHGRRQAQGAYYTDGGAK